MFPNTLYFLAVGCDGTVSVEGTDSTRSGSGTLVGLPDYTTAASTSLSTSWTYSAGNLPATFPTIGYSSSTVIANVYAGP